MTRKAIARPYIKERHDYVNHTPIVKTLGIRLQYRVYLAEMESYEFCPLSFREWHRYFINKESK